jgi:transposase
LEKHNGKAENIKQVSIDMSPAFIKGFKENIPNAEITFDKFHNIKMINSAVDKVRREESKTMFILKKSRYVFLKNERNLKETERKKLEEIKMSKLNIKSLRALHIRENFQAIYQAETKEKFIILLKKWYFWATHSRLEPIIEIAKTMKRHWDGIVAWVESRINNGILEGLNSMIQSSKRKARGFRSTKNLMIISYLVTGDLNFKSINKFYKPL